MSTTRTRPRLLTSALATTGALAAAAVVAIVGGSGEPEPTSIQAAAVGDVRPAPAPDGGTRISQRALVGAMQQRQHHAGLLSVLDLTPPEPEVVVAAEADPEPVPEPEPEPEPVAAPTRASLDTWYALAQCESNGNWQETAGTFEGGLQFHPGTWDAYRPAGYPDAAYQATPAQQIAVAEMVLAQQGWGAWPACSAKLGLR